MNISRGQRKLKKNKQEIQKFHLIFLMNIYFNNSSAPSAAFDSNSDGVVHAQVRQSC